MHHKEMHQHHKEMHHREMHRHKKSHQSLDQLELGGTAKIAAVNGEGALRDRLLDMGLTPGTNVMLRKVAPMGDPIELTLRGYELTLRVSDAKEIEIVREAHDNRIGRKPELRQDDAVQSADGFESACGEFSGCHGRSKRRHHSRP